jgi:ornithine cyclodeaminase/alanine dehydrogenase-like protein (mu-crystallin family)
MKTRVLGAADVTQLLETVGRDELMDLMIERLRARFLDHSADAVEVRARDGFRYEKPDLGLIEWMPTHETGGPVVVKMVGYHPANPVQRALPSVIATSSMWDTETGHLVALADSTLLTAMRTGAASAVATDLLARTGPLTVGVVGLGAQGVTQVHAVSRVRPIARVIGIDVDEQVAASFSARLGDIGAHVEIADVDRARTILGEVDVLCTCTSVDIGAGPVIDDAEARPWLHVNAVGADFPGKLELPGEFVRRSLVVPDVLSQCLLEGECQQVPSSAIGPELAELVARGDTDAWRQQVTVFDSTGWAVEDDVALRLAVDLADSLGLGTDIELEYLPADPFDPYSPALTTAMEITT